MRLSENYHMGKQTDEHTPELALKLIAENKKTRVPFLDLGNCGFNEIPSEVAKQEWQERQHFSVKLKWGPIRFQREKLAGN